jgi:hypothetical protein
MQDFMQQLASGALTPVTILSWTLVSLLLAVAGGAAGAVRLAGKDLGPQLAMLMGALFGPVATVPAVLLGLLVLRFT